MYHDTDIDTDTYKEKNCVDVYVVLALIEVTDRDL